MNRRTWAAMVGLAALCGCASPPPLTPIRDGSSVRIEVSMSGQALGSKDIENSALGHDTSRGAAAGAVAGGLWGFACGPFAFVCVPAGAGLGALSGTVAGAGIGLTGALSSDKATALRARLKRWAEADPPLEVLRRQLDDRGRRHWRVVESGADASVTLRVELQDLVLSSSRDEQIGFALHVMVSTQPAGAAGPVAQKAYSFTGPTSSLAVWLDEHNDDVETSLRLAMQQLAAQIVSDLARF